MKVAGCPLCEGPGGAPVFECSKYRVIRVFEAGFPAFYRVVWRAHVAEFSDLSDTDRALVMGAVVEIERAMRQHLSPDKINLAALGNAVPHLHWHVVARFKWDSHFPGSVWSPLLRESPAANLQSVEAGLSALDADIATRLADRPGNCTAL
ncbi:MAG: HIT family protein [Ramlibacter sp.]|nr:HIT family protein [Ramlibacter sp.]